MWFYLCIIYEHPVPKMYILWEQFLFNTVALDYKSVWNISRVKKTKVMNDCIPTHISGCKKTLANWVTHVHNYKRKSKSTPAANLEGYGIEDYEKEEKNGRGATWGKKN